MLWSRAAFVVVLAALVASACASGTGVARPSPFPAAPGRPSPGRPASMPVSPAPIASEVIQTALGFQGVPYRLGGDSPKRGFDCSGFVQFVFSVNRITLPRTVLEQSALGYRVNPGDLQPGDLVFFATGSRGVSHVGIAIGRGQFVHAPADNGVVRVDSVQSTYWKSHFLEARRVVL
jgi:murein DD-endopeptidase